MLSIRFLWGFVSWIIVWGFWEEMRQYIRDSPRTMQCNAKRLKKVEVCTRYATKKSPTPCACLLSTLTVKICFMMLLLCNSEWNKHFACYTVSEQQQRPFNSTIVLPRDLTWKKWLNHGKSDFEQTLVNQTVLKMRRNDCHSISFQRYYGLFSVEATRYGINILVPMLNTFCDILLGQVLLLCLIDQAEIDVETYNT